MLADSEVVRSEICNDDVLVLAMLVTVSDVSFIDGRLVEVEACDMITLFTHRWSFLRASVAFGDWCSIPWATNSAVPFLPALRVIAAVCQSPRLSLLSVNSRSGPPGFVSSAHNQHKSTYLDV